MGYAIYQMNGRDCGYGVPAMCDRPNCAMLIDRGIGYCCGGAPDSEDGCHLYFCRGHLMYVEFTNDRGYREISLPVCDNCALSLRIGWEGDNYKMHPAPYEPKPDALQWVVFKLNHESWQNWRLENHEEVVAMRRRVEQEPALAKAIYDEFKKDGEL